MSTEQEFLGNDKTKFSPKFTDSKNNEWDLSLNFGIAKKIDEGDFSTLCKPFSIINPDENMLKVFLINQGVVAAICYQICLHSGQIKKKLEFSEHSEESEYAFTSLLDGPALGRMKQGFWGSLQDFFPLREKAFFLMVQDHQKNQELLDLELEKRREELSQLTQREIKNSVEDTFNRLKRELGRESEETPGIQDFGAC